VVRFETEPGDQVQVYWVEFRKGRQPLYAFCATLGYSRASFVEFVINIKVDTLIACHHHAFDYFGGVPKRVLSATTPALLYLLHPCSRMTTCKQWCWNGMLREKASIVFIRCFWTMPVIVASSSSCADPAGQKPKGRLSASMAIYADRFKSRSLRNSNKSV